MIEAIGPAKVEETLEAVEAALGAESANLLRAYIKGLEGQIYYLRVKGPRPEPKPLKDTLLG